MVLAPTLSSLFGLSPFFVEQWEAGKYKDIAPPEFNPSHLNWALDLTTAISGYREGVVRVPIDKAGWKTPVVITTKDSVFQTVVESRVEGETPRRSTKVLVEELPSAELVEVILYNRSVLEEKDEPRSGAVWDVITILAQPTNEPAPMNVRTLLSNHYNSDGGSNTLMSPEAFEKALKESFEYWKDKAMGQIHQRAFRSVAIWPRLKDAGIDVEVLADAYDWSISVNGDLSGLVAGDHGYVPTGIKLNVIDTKIWNMGLQQYLHSEEYLTD